MAACSGEDADDKIDCRPAYCRVQNDSLGALAAHFCNLVGRGEGGGGVFYLEFLVSSPIVSTNSLKAGEVSRLCVLNRHVCAAWGGGKDRVG